MCVLCTGEAGSRVVIVSKTRDVLVRYPSSEVHPPSQTYSAWEWKPYSLGGLGCGVDADSQGGRGNRRRTHKRLASEKERTLNSSYSERLPD